MTAFADPKKLYFFFDFISHNAYLAWQKVPEIASRHGLALVPVPVLFAAQLQAFKQAGPAEIPPKRNWMLWNVLRKAKQHDIPIAPPHTHPFNPLLPLRACCAVDGADRIKLVDRLYRATWAESKAVSTPEVVAQEVAACGLDPNTVAAVVQSEPVKAQLRANTEGALAAGIFGVPTMLVRGEIFWGFDDLGYLELFLSGRDPIPADRSVYAAWMQVRPSAERRK
jgi:2-hydroxychromene-2-carboxylate isomerase